MRISTTGRGGNRKLRRVAVLVLTAVAGAGAAMFVAGGPASAAGEFKTIRFTENGASPAFVRIEPGDTVKFGNSIEQGSSNEILGQLFTDLDRVTVEVENAAAEPFSLSPGEERSVSYRHETTITYRAVYEAQRLGLLRQEVGTTQGTIRISNDSAEVPPPAQQPRHEPSPSPAPRAAVEPKATPKPAQVPDVGSVSSTGDAAFDSLPPTGLVESSSSPSSEPTSSSSAAPVPSGSSTPQAQSLPHTPQLASQELALPQVNDPDFRPVSESSSRLGLPTLLAVVLLSIVSAGLVRTFFAHRQAANA